MRLRFQCVLKQPSEDVKGMMLCWIDDCPVRVASIKTEERQTIGPPKSECEEEKRRG